MSFDVQAKLQQYKKESESKAQAVLAQQINQGTRNSTGKQYISVQNIKQDIGKQSRRLAVKSTITNLNLSPTKSPRTPYVQKYHFASNLSTARGNTMGSPQKANYQSFLTVPPPPRQQINESHSQIKLYSAKYQKILSEEQGAYYSMLQTKLDSLAQLIGAQQSSSEQIREIDNLISQSAQGQVRNVKEKKMDQVSHEKRALQTDLQNLSYKISRSKLSDFTEI